MAVVFLARAGHSFSLLEVMHVVVAVTNAGLEQMHGRSVSDLHPSCVEVAAFEAQDWKQIGRADTKALMSEELEPAVLAVLAVGVELAMGPAACALVLMAKRLLTMVKASRVGLNDSIANFLSYKAGMGLRVWGLGEKRRKMFNSLYVLLKCKLTAHRWRTGRVPVHSSIHGADSLISRSFCTDHVP
jgi:hypothetical protein